MSPFKWNDKRSQAAVMLADGYTIDEVAEAIGVNSRSVDRWKADIEFSQEVDRLGLMVGIANKAERLKIARRMIRNLAKKQVPTHKDLLEWLKYAQGETDGIKLDLTPLFENVASLASGGSGRVEGITESTSEEGD